RSGRAQRHVPQQPGRARDLQGAKRHGLSEDAGRERLLLPSDAWEFPMGNVQMVGKSVPAMYRGEKPLMTKLAPTFTLDDAASHAIDFWLSTEDLPVPENRVSVDADGNSRPAYRPTNDTARVSPLPPLR